MRYGNIIVKRNILISFGVFYKVPAINVWKAKVMRKIEDNCHIYDHMVHETFARKAYLCPRAKMAWT